MNETYKYENWKPLKPQLCGCGCGKNTSGKWCASYKRYAKYIKGHQLIGKKCPWVTEMNIKNKEKNRERMLKLYKGGILINKGKDHPMYGFRRFGKDNPMYGKKRIDIVQRNLMNNPTRMLKVRQKISEKAIKRFKEGKQVSPNLGKTLSKEIKLKISKAHKKLYKRGRKLSGCAKLSKTNPTWHPAFNNYSSKEPYGIEFSLELKELIRQRDNFRCQQCFRHQNELFKKNRKGETVPSKLDIHHIDFNKKNNDSNNLISLCRNCHSQTQFNRKDWVSYFQDRINRS